MIISFTTQKGGTGKSTTVTNVAHALLLAGYSVCILDTDEQATIVSFDQSRRLLTTSAEAEGIDLSFPMVQSLTSKQPYREFIERIRSRFDYILIDTKGEFSQFQYDLVRLSDFVVCPIAPSEFDFRPTILVHDAVNHENNQRKDDGGKIGMAYCITNADNTNTLKHIVGLVEQETGRPILSPYMRKSDAIRSCAGVGLTVFDAERSLKEVKRVINAERSMDAQSSIDKDTVEGVCRDIRAIADHLRSLCS